MDTDPACDFSEREKALVLARIVDGALSVKSACDRYGLSSEEIRSWATIYRHSVRRALDARLTRTLANEGIETGDLLVAEFSGTLAEISVADLVQTMALARKDGVITVAQAGFESRIWCVQGAVMDAESGSLQGSAAFYRILALEDGHVYARFCPVQRARTIDAPTHALLLEAAQRKDEARLPAEASAEPSCAAHNDARDVLPHSAGLLEPMPVLEGPAARGGAPAHGVRAALDWIARFGRTWQSARERSQRALQTWRARVDEARPTLARWLHKRGQRGALRPPAPEHSHDRVGDAFALSRRARRLAPVLLVAFAAVGAWSHASQDPSRPERRTARAAVAPPPSATARPLAREPAAFVQLRTELPEAQVWLDGRQVGHGSLAIHLPRDGRPHELRIASDRCAPPSPPPLATPMPPEPARAEFAAPARRPPTAAPPRAAPEASLARTEAPRPPALLASRARARWPSAGDRSLHGLAPVLHGLAPLLSSAPEFDDDAVPSPDPQPRDDESPAAILPNPYLP